MALRLDRKNRGFIAGSHHLAEETDCRMFFKVARKIQTTTVIKKHCELNTRFRSTDFAQRSQLTINSQLKIVQLKIDESVASRINYRNRYWNQVRRDPHNVIGI